MTPEATEREGMPARKPSSPKSAAVIRRKPTAGEAGSRGPRRAPAARATAQSLAKEQREISISEFFTKNRHLLGFDSPAKALLTTIKEAVDNSLDACEEAGILPEVRVEIHQLGEPDGNGAAGAPPGGNGDGSGGGAAAEDGQALALAGADDEGASAADEAAGNGNGSGSGNGRRSGSGRTQHGSGGRDCGRSGWSGGIGRRDLRSHQVTQLALEQVLRFGRSNKAAGISGGFCFLFHLFTE